MRGVMISAFLFVAWAISGFGDALAQSTADTVYTNGKIYTVNEKQPWAEAVAIKDGKFVKVGSNADVKANTGKGTKVIDLKGQFVVPGFHDTHVHIEQAYITDKVGDALLSFPVGASVEKMQELLKEYAEKNPKLEVLFAQGLELANFPNSEPTKEFIDKVIPDRPVVMLDTTEHVGLLNSKALEMEGITAKTETPKGGDLLKDQKTGEPTGLTRETAAGKWAWKHFPDVTPDQHRDGLAAIIQYLNSIGITSVKQQHAKNPVATAAQALEKDGKLNARIALSWTYKGPLEPMPLDEQENMFSERGRFASDMIKTEFVKLSGDGNAGSTGLVIEPYLVSGTSGISVFNADELFAEVEKFDQMGVGVTIHSTGDGANRMMIDVLEKVKKKHGALKARHQLGHSTLIHPDDIARMKALDVTAEFSPVIWYPGDFPNAQREQLGEERWKRWYPINSVAKADGRIALASDGPLMWHVPLQTLETAVTRKAPGGKGDALNPHEAIDLATAIKAVTLNSAYIMNQEKSVGSIEVGKQADMVVLDKNLFDIPATDISSSKVMLTVFDGKVVYDVATGPTGEEAIEKETKVQLDLSGNATDPNNDWNNLIRHPRK
jgi:predicted amidohydrolase YtcJ